MNHRQTIVHSPQLITIHLFLLAMNHRQTIVHSSQLITIRLLSTQNPWVNWEW